MTTNTAPQDHSWIDDELARWSTLPDVYLYLYRTIQRHRPSLQAQTAMMAQAMRDVDVEYLSTSIDHGMEQIDATFAYIKLARQRIESGQAGVFTDLLAVDIYRKIYTHANYWYVLLDGLLLEGAFEYYGNSLLAHSSDVLKMDSIELLQEIVDPATIRYVEAREELGATDRLADILAGLREADAELAERFGRFCLLYEQAKSWQGRFAEISKRTFQACIPGAREAVVEVAQQYAVGLCSDDLHPYHLLDVIEERIVPAIFASMRS